MLSYVNKMTLCYLLFIYLCYLFIFQYLNPSILKITSRVFSRPISPKKNTQKINYIHSYIRSTLDLKASADADRIIVNGRAFHFLMVCGEKMVVYSLRWWNFVT